MLIIEIRGVETDETQKHVDPCRILHNRRGRKSRFRNRPDGMRKKFFCIRSTVSRRIQNHSRCDLRLADPRLNTGLRDSGRDGWVQPRNTINTRTLGGIFRTTKHTNSTNQKVRSAEVRCAATQDAGCGFLPLFRAIRLIRGCSCPVVVQSVCNSSHAES